MGGGWEGGWGGDKRKIQADTPTRCKRRQPWVSNQNPNGNKTQPWCRRTACCSQRISLHRKTRVITLPGSHCTEKTQSDNSARISLHRKNKSDNSARISLHRKTRVITLPGSHCTEEQLGELCHDLTAQKNKCDNSATISLHRRTLPGLNPPSPAAGAAYLHPATGGLNSSVGSVLGLLCSVLGLLCSVLGLLCSVLGLLSSV